MMNMVILLLVTGFVLAGVCLVAFVTAIVSVIVHKARKASAVKPAEELSEEQAAEIVATQTLLNH